MPQLVLEAIATDTLFPDPQAELSICVTQYHMWAWPVDQAPPSSPENMLALVQESKQHCKETGHGLTVVHSSCKYVYTM